ncbi:hypothetical protein HK096_002141 [Nowakowskiella sp. JEL0078]|nr:hypothetical protein HK096_002141 [Nowakowskiella sp. JEL0078]
MMSALQTPAKTKTVAFEIEVNKPQKTPERIAKKIEQIGMKRAISQEEFNAKLSSAAARKKNIEQERAVKAKEIVDRAKEIASRTRQETDEELNVRLEKLKEKLDSAAGKRGANVIFI